MAAPTSLPGARWRQTHQASVDAVLGAGTRSVTSRGSMFLNKDNWTARKFVDELCNWAKANPGRTPTSYDVAGWVNTANCGALGWNEQPGIVIAETPDDLPVATAMSLVGGAYHEAWHTKYSRRTELTVAEVMPEVMRLWSAVPNWGPLVGALLTWSNIVEDIRIERLGNAQYPGSKPRLEALQDLILRMEADSREEAIRQNVPVNDDLNVVTCAFRDLGLGYTTVTQRTALKDYRDRSPESYELVENGDLRPILDAAINLTKADDLACIWLAMAIVARIVQSAKEEEQNPPPPKSPKPPKSPPQSGNGKGSGKGKGDEEEDDSDEDDSDEDDTDDSDGEDGEEADDDSNDTDDGDDGEEDEDGEEADGNDGNDGNDDTRKPTYKIGDRARVATGPYAGREVQVTFAGKPDANGIQVLEFALVEGE